MTKSVTKVQDKDTSKRLSVVRSTEDPTKYWVVILNPDGSKIRWPKGDKGDAATVNVGTTTTGNPWTDANVTNSWTTSAAVFNFTIPRGDQGEIWETGNGIESVTSEKVGKVTTVTIEETNGDEYSFSVSDGADGVWAWDVLWPNSSTDGDIVLFNGATGKYIKDSGVWVNGFVQTSWNQSIGWTKTFTTSPVVPSKSSDAGNNPTTIATEAQVKKVKDAIPSVINSLSSTSITDALSAAQGKALKDDIDDLKALGKFLSLWDSSTWLPISFPQAIPYTYSTWDYFLVETVDTTTNYKPTGSSYTGTASAVVETDEVEVWDLYIYDGTTWLLQINHWKSVSFTNLAGSPEDNAALDSALDAKQDVLIAWSNISIAADGKTISATDTTYTAWTNVQISDWNVISATDTTYTAGTNIQINWTTISATDTTYSAATSSAAGIVKLGSDTVQNVNANAVSGTVDRTYAIQTDSNWKMVVNVPWTASVTSVNGATWAVTVSEFNATNWGTKIFEFPAVNHSISDAIAWATNGWGVIFQYDSWLGTVSHFLIDNWDTSTREMVLSCLIWASNEIWKATVTYNSSWTVTAVTDNFISLWGDVMVSSQANNILTSWMKIWAWTQANYQALGSYDTNTVYLTIE